MFYLIFFTIFVTSYITRLYNMGFPTKVQLIKRAKSEQWYINFPAAVAQAMEFEKGEIVEWVVIDKQRMTLKRTKSKDGHGKKKLNK